MTSPAKDLPHDFPDRAIRDILSHPDNMRELLSRVIPELVALLDFARRQEVSPTFLLDDYRERESDLLFEVPFLNGTDRPPLLICLLIEHQSSVDDVMPLRLLFYAVSYWEKQWRQWASSHARGQRLRLTPVVPVVFYTGSQSWDGYQTLDELFETIEPLQVCIPKWKTWLCDLTTFDPGELVQRSEAFWQAMAVVRSEQAAREEFFKILKEALNHLEPVAEQDRPRWDQLQKLVLYWTFYRRSKKDREQALTLVRSTQTGVLFRQEIEAMAKQIEMSYEQEIILESKKKGREEAMAEVVERDRHILQKILLRRFGAIPEMVQQKIAAADETKLATALEEAAVVSSPEELPL